MKKHIAYLLVCILLLMSVGAAAEEAEPFALSNGVRWGMTSEQVSEMEDRKSDYDETFSDSVQGNIYYKSRFSKFATVKEYLFGVNGLFAVAYGDFSPKGEDDAEYLRNAVSVVYGEPHEADASALKVFFESIMQADIDQDFGTVLEWTIHDQTVIWMFLVGEEIVLMYVRDDWTGSESYDITGI